MIEVKYITRNTPWHINEQLLNMHQYPMMSLDLETRGVYAKAERKLALKLLAFADVDEARELYHLVAMNNGLSYPSLVEVTHFVFGLSKSSSIILIPENSIQELFIWNWITNYRGKLLIHNALFDLKIMYHRTGLLPNDYEDTALLAKSLTNHSKSWLAKIDLKDIMGKYYSPKWTLIDEYEPENPKDEKFLRYAAIDGAATYYLWELLNESI